MSRWSSLLVAATGLLACHLALARVEDPPQKVDEIIVSGERAGPGLWQGRRAAVDFCDCFAAAEGHDVEIETA
jgi:hypothetical protein